MAVERAVCCAGSADFSCVIHRDCAGHIGLHDLFTAENTGDADLSALARRTMRFSQAVANLGQQWVMGHTALVVHVHPMGMTLATGSTDANKRNF